MRLTKRSIIVILFVALAVLYVLLAAFLPVDAYSLNKYNLTEEHAHLLSLYIAVPYIVIWFTGLYGYLQLDTYAKKIKHSSDGKGFAKLASGLLILVLAMPLETIVRNVDLYFTNAYPHFLPAATMINNYTNLIPVLIAFYVVYTGAKSLYLLLPTFKVEAADAELVPSLFVLASTWYAYFTLKNPAREHPIASVKAAAFYLPDWLIVATIILPYIAVLYFGFSSVVYLRMYLKHVPGIFYKQALRLIANGMLITITALISLRILNSMTTWFESRTLQVVLIIVYCLLLVMSIGYVFITRGARKLSAIESISDSNYSLPNKKLARAK